MITPFDKDGNVDTLAASRIAQRLAHHSISVFLLGTTGETASISCGQRALLVKEVVEAVAGTVPIYAGIGDNCFSDSLEAADSYLRAGARAVVAHLPSYYPLSDEEKYSYFKMLHDRIRGELILYNIPATTHMSLPVDVVEQLSGLPRVVGFKDSERVPERMYEISRRFEGVEQFALFMGTAVYSVEALKLGFHGLVPNSGNLIPALWAQLMDCALREDWEQAEVLQQQANDVALVFQGGRSLGQSLAALKVLMAKHGLCSPWMLPPLQPTPDDDKERLFKAYEAMQRKCGEMAEGFVAPVGAALESVLKARNT